MPNLCCVLSLNAHTFPTLIVHASYHTLILVAFLYNPNDINILCILFLWMSCTFHLCCASLGCYCINFPLLNKKACPHTAPSSFVSLITTFPLQIFLCHSYQTLPSPSRLTSLSLLFEETELSYLFCVYLGLESYSQL